MPSPPTAQLRAAQAREKENQLAMQAARLVVG